jgi:outer membrane protein OmpA-like peptidoglycan-associated protein
VRATDGRGNVGAQECINVVVESTTTPLAITVESVTEADGAAFPAALRPYAKLWVVPADGSLPNAGDYDYDTRQDPVAERHVDRGGDLFGTHGENVTTGSGTAIVHIEAGLETRGANGIVLSRTPMDLSPTGGDSNASLVFTVDLETGLWSDHDGPANAPVSCVASPATPDTDTFAGRLCFAVSTMSLTGDLDEDGLLDHWETMGLNTDTDPVIEVDLPTMGATPDHKDLFVEYDVEDDAVFTSDTETGLKRVIDAFARAPIDAGGTVSNPDGQPGIRLWIDSPSSDPALSMGGGQIIGTGRICDLADAGFYDAKRRGFDYDRKWVFRYAIKESDDDENAQNKEGCAPGGQAEIGGNDFVVFNQDDFGETFMHELGHTLTLRHGGFENANNKPNYVSIMNYAYAFDLRRQSAGDAFLDFSPVRRVDNTRPSGLLRDIAEASPPQGKVLGPDRDHEIIYTSFDCSFTRANVSDPFDVLPNTPGPDSSPAYGFLNLPNDAFVDSKGNPVTPGICAVPNLPLRVFRDHNDWAAIDLKFRHSGDSQDGPINPSDDEDFPNDEEIALREIVSTTTDLAVEISTPAAPTPVGVTAEVIVAVSNRGTIPADEPSVELVVAQGLAVTSAPGYCDTATLVCRPALLASGESVDIPVQVRATAVGDQSVDAVVANATGPEANAEDNTASAVVTTIAAVPDPDPTPSVTPSPAASATASPSPSVSPTPSPTPSAGTGPPAPVTTTKVVKTYFRLYSGKLTKVQKRKLRRAVSAIPEDAKVAVKARGMVRAEGATKADRKRAKQRAKAVRAYLKTRGVPGSAISVNNKGRTQSQSAKARRVNVKFTYTTSALG